MHISKIFRMHINTKQFRAHTFPRFPNNISANMQSFSVKLRLHFASCLFSVIWIKSYLNQNYHHSRMKPYRFNVKLTYISKMNRCSSFENSPARRFLWTAKTGFQIVYASCDASSKCNFWWNRMYDWISTIRSAYLRTYLCRR